VIRDSKQRALQQSPQRTLRETLREIGLAGRVHVGAVPNPNTPTPEGPVTGQAQGESGAGAFSLDRLLRPLERETAGRVIEIGGSRSSGRTALAYRISAGATSRGELVGWVDPADALEPRFLARAGTDLERLLWVRSRGARETFRAAELLLKAGFAVVVIDLWGVEVRALQRLGNAAWSRLQRSARSRAATVLILTCVEHTAPRGVAPRAGIRKVPTREAERREAETREAEAGAIQPVQGWAGAFATLGLATQRRRARFEWGLFEGFDAHACIVRQRAGPSGDTLAFHLLHLPESARTEAS